MLIEFSVANFRSICERQTFSMVKAKGNELPDNTFEVEASNKFTLLKSAAIYGPNAAGKSNFLLAVHAMKDIIIQSAKNMQRGNKLPVTPFRLARATRNKPSEFEVHFIVDGIRYQYGFSATEERIYAEWLLAYPKGRPQHWFEREWDKKTKGYEWHLGGNLTGPKQAWQNATRDNALFLSTAIQLNNQQFQPIYDWFFGTLQTETIFKPSPLFTALLCEEKGAKEQVIKFLQAAELNIENIVVERQPLYSTGMAGLTSMVNEGYTSNRTEGRSHLKITTFHKDAEGKLVPFDFENESDGTQRIFSLAGYWLTSLLLGGIMFFDELHDNLHPELALYLVQMFHDKRINRHNAQLIFTTHETSLLNQEVIRRDQVWFCESHKEQATELYPLTDFSPRKGFENLELAYLSDRYGAMPYIKRRQMRDIFDEQKKAA